MARLGVWLTCLVLIPGGTRAATAVTWAQLEPAFRMRYAVVAEGPYFTHGDAEPWPATGPAPPSEAVLAVAADVTAAVRQRVSLFVTRDSECAMSLIATDGIQAATEALRKRLFEDALFLRVTKAALPDALAAHGLTCEDCAPEPLVPRRVAFADLTPYLVRFVAMGPHDLPPPGGEANFHVCTGINGLRTLPQVDMPMAATSLAVMWRAVHLPDHGFEPVGDHLLEALKASEGKATRTVDEVNAAWWQRLESDQALLDKLRPLVREEAPTYGLECTDCGLAPSRVAPLH